MPAKTAAPATRAAARRLGCYLYAITDAAGARDFGPIGIDGGSVYCISDGPAAAVVSDVPNQRMRPERRRLAAHHEVLKQLLARQTVLPMAFGLVADDADAIRAILRTHRTALAEQLRRLAGKVEMGLRVRWDVPNIFEFFVNTHTELRALRDNLFRGSRDPSQNDKIELGRLFDRVLAADRADRTAHVLRALQPRCVEIKENKPRDECEVMSLACLIDRDGQKDFEQGVFEAANYFDHHYAFDFNGPWPPHNFVDVAIQLPTARREA